MQLLDDKPKKQKLAPVLLVRWSPKVRGNLSQGAGGKNLALFVDGLAILAGEKIVPEPGQHRRSGSKGGGDGLGHGIQFRKIGGGTRLVRSHIGWRFSSTRRGVRSHDKCDRLVVGRTCSVMIIIIRGRHGYWSNPKPVETRRSRWNCY